MGCEIRRDSKNNITKVIAENGRESILFNEIVNLGYDKESALKKWALVYTPTFKEWFGKGSVDANGEPQIFNLPTTQSSTSIKEGVQELFESNSELANLGTVEQYNEYLDTIFPDSKVKDIVYHTNTQGRIKSFNPERGLFVTPTLELAKTYKPGLNGKRFQLIINSKNIDEVSEETIMDGKKQSGDTLMYSEPNYTEYVVFKPEQIHILGSKQDIEGFKEFTTQSSTQLSTSNNNQLDLFENSQATLQPPIFIAEDSSTKHATENLGSFKSKKDPSPLLNKIKQRFRLVHPNGNVRNISYNENPERIAEKIEKEYPGVTAYVVQDVGGDYISLGVSPHLNVDNIYHQVESDMLADRDKEIDLAMAHFLKSIGVRIKGVDNIRDKNGKIISATAKADMVNKIVEYTKGKIKLDTLPEEAAHFMVELLEAQKSPLFTAMMNNITGFQVYKDVLDNPIYQELYKGDLNKLKKEAIGKLIAKHIINDIKGDNAVQIQRLAGWWQRVKEFLMNLFGQTITNPYARAAQIMLNDTVNDYVNVKSNLGSITGEYFQAEQNDNTHDLVGDTIEKFDKENENWETSRVSLEKAGLKQPWFVEEGNETERYVGKVGGPYAGQIIRGRVSDSVKEYFWKINRGKIMDLTGKEAQLRLNNNQIRKSTGTMGHAVLAGLIDLHANKKGDRNTILKNSLFTSSEFQVLEQGILDLIKKVKAEQKLIDPEGKVIFRTEQMITNRDRSIGGSIDLIAVFSDNSASIFDFKFVSPAKAYLNSGNKIIEDPFNVKIPTYDLQLSAYKSQLKENYGISTIRQSRIVPIHIRFKTEKGGELKNAITLVEMGTKYSEFLEQIPVAGELTRFEDLNEIIRQLLARKQIVDRQLQTKNYIGGASFESLKLQQARITSQLRKLQIDQDLAYVVKALKNDLTLIQNRLGQDNPTDPEYLSDEDLNVLLEDLLFYRSLVSLSKFLETMDPIAKDEYEKEQKAVAGIILTSISAVQGAMIQRVTDKADARGVRGIKDFNLDLSWMTENFVNLSKQTNPFLRNLWEIMNKLNYNKRRIVKQKAEEIQIAQDAFLKGRGIEAFDILLDKNGNFKAKFTPEYYQQKNNAIQSGDFNWFDIKNGNVQIDKEYYELKYKLFRDGKIKALKANSKNTEQTIKRELLKWELAHDVKNHPKTASISKGGQYFLRPTDKWISSEYNAIQNDPGAKAFYDLYMQTVREVEEMYGQRLGPNFTADVRKTAIESLFVNGSVTEVIDSTVENLQVREDDKGFGVIDPNTGKQLPEIPKLYITALRDKNGNIDTSLKSRDLGKGLLLLFDAALDYQLKHDVLPEIQMMEAILKTDSIKVQRTDMFGDMLQDAGIMDTQQPQELYKAYQMFVNGYIYGQSTATSKDTQIGKFSGTKTVLSLKQLNSITVLGAKLPVALGAFFAGMLGTYYEAAKGTFVTNKNLRTAQLALLSADPKMRALVEHLDFYQKDDGESRANRLSAQYVTRHMTNDKWFAFLSTADRGIDATVLYALALNFGVDSEGRVKRLELLPKDSKNLIELMTFTENPAWKATAINASNKAVDRYKVEIKGLSEEGELKFRTIGREISGKIKGHMSSEDLSLYNQNFYMKLLMHYKSWLPGIAMARFGKQKYNNILETFDEGTWASYWHNTDMAGTNTARQALDTEIHALEYFKSFLLDVVNTITDAVTFGYLDRTSVKEELARARFDVWAANNANNPDFKDKLKNPAQREELFKEFIAMKKGNIKAFLVELRISLGLILLLMSLTGDDDDDGTRDIRQSYTSRKLHNVLNRIYREQAVFTNPASFFESGRSTAIPLLGLVTDAIKLVGNTVDEIGDDLSGTAPYSEKDKAERFYYTFKLFPGINALTKAVEYFPTQKNEEY